MFEKKGNWLVRASIRNLNSKPGGAFKDIRAFSRPSKVEMEQTKRTWKERGAGWSKPVDGIWIETLWRVEE